MSTKKSTLDEVKQWHEAGRLEAAEQGYLALLEEDPNEVEALHLLGVLYAEEGRLQEAQTYLEKASHLSPHNASIHLHLANIFKAQADYAQAESLLQTLMQTHPEFAASYNNLGTLYLTQGRLSHAIQAFQTAIDKQPDYADAYYNLGLALMKASRREEAFNVFKALLALSPHHPGGLFQQGCLYMQQAHYQNALDCFLPLAKAHSYHLETLVNVASCYLKINDMHEAKSYYLRALTLAPHDTQVLFNLGVISMQQGRTKEAIDYYLQAVKLNPDFCDAHNNLCVAYLALNDSESALLHFSEVLRIQPNNEAVRHTIKILKREKGITNSPPEYIRSLFDSYADHYDTHLTQALNYQVPALIEARLKDILPPNDALNVLDMGCGTGLCGKFLRPWASMLTGVDLSEKMLAVAAQKELYDQLVVEEMVTYLIAHPTTYDLMVAGDVIVYFGDLAEVMSTAAQALKPQGIWIFNTEESEEAYHMTESGRFAHSQPYVESLAQKNGLAVMSAEPVTFRVQKGKPVAGRLYILSKLASLA